MDSTTRTQPHTNAPSAEEAARQREPTIVYTWPIALGMVLVITAMADGEVNARIYCRQA